MDVAKSVRSAAGDLEKFLYEFDRESQIPIVAHFSEPRSKISHCHMFQAPMAVERSANAERSGLLTKYTFTNEGEYEFLEYALLVYRWNKLTVKPEYPNIVICYPHNLGFAPLDKCELLSGKNPPIQTIDLYYCDGYRQINTEDKEHDDICLGNIPSMENWAKELPEYITHPILPFFYSANDTDGFPLYKASLSHCLTVKTYLRDIIMMGRIVPEYVDKENNITIPAKIVPLKKSEIRLDYITGFPEEGRLNVPEIHAGYCITNDGELKYNSIPEMNLIYVRDKVTYKSKSSLPGQSKTQKLEDSPHNYECLFVMAENIESTNCNSTSNYTTHPLFHSEGNDPIQYTTIDLLGKPWKFKAENFYFNGPHMSRIFKSLPFETGYRIIPISKRPFSHDMGTTFPMKRLEGVITNILEEFDQIQEFDVRPSESSVEYHSKMGDFGNSSVSGKVKSSYKIIIVGVVFKIYRFDSEGGMHLVNPEELKKKGYKLTNGTDLGQFSSKSTD